MFLVMFQVSEWARPVLEILKFNKQPYVSMKKNISHFSVLGWCHQRRLLHRNVQGQWKFKSMTNQWTNGRMDGLTWVGARDTCVSKNRHCTPYCQVPPPTW